MLIVRHTFCIKSLFLCFLDYFSKSVHQVPLVDPRMITLPIESAYVVLLSEILFWYFKRFLASVGVYMLEN